MNIENIQFKNNLSQMISGRLYKGDTVSNTGVVFCHGLFSTKDGYKITRLAEDIVKSGNVLLTFDFSFTGESEGNISDLSILQEVEDLRCAVKYIFDYGIERLHIFGSSMGAAVSLLFTSEVSKFIDSLIVIAAPVKLTEVVAGNININDIDSLPGDSLTKIDGVPIKNSFLKELKDIDMLDAVNKITVPVLIIHGENDEIVDISNAEILKNKLKSYNKSIVIDDGGHNLTRDNDIEIIRDGILSWFKETELFKVSGVKPEK